MNGSVMRNRWKHEKGRSHITGVPKGKRGVEQQKGDGNYKT